MNDLPQSERGRILSGLATTLATLSLEQPQAWRLGEAMRRMLQADGVAITVEYLTDRRTTVYATDHIADALESLQEVTGEGPGFEAARSDTIIVADLDDRSRQRWPMLGHALAEREYGPLNVYAVPVRPHGHLAGVATAYTRPGRPLDEPPDRVAFLANAVGAALLADTAGPADGQPHAGEGWASRTIVHQATGMVMAQVRLSAADALALLRSHAYATDSEIGDVAARVVGREISFTNFAVQGD